MSNEVQLLGLDFGTTTSSAVVASATLAQSAVTGRMDLSQIRERYRSDMVFTPLGDDDRLDELQMEHLLDNWMAAGEIRREDLFGGGALLTGLTAQKTNAETLVRLVRRHIGDALIATANDPCLESWLAFMGSCADLSRSLPQQPILNLDIGGGTTNLALGINGEVLHTGCLFVGARHVEVIPGSYRIVRLSRYARAVLDSLNVHKGPGDGLTEAEVQAILGYYVRLLEAAVAGTVTPFRTPVGRLHEQVAFRGCPHDVAITFSGGVGELIYAHAQGQAWPPASHFGDLGIDLAQRLVASPFWSCHVRAWSPASAGRATVYGLLRHSTEVSGSTLFLPHPDVLPLHDLPILGSLSGSATDDHLAYLVDLVRRSAHGGCVQVSVDTHEALAVRALGDRLAATLRRCAFPAQQPLVLLVRENLGKVLGGYVTQWGTLPLNLIVIDEVAVRDAQYVQLGRLRSQVVPVSFYGLNERGDSP